MKKECALTGKLTFICLADLMQILGTNGSSGILKLTSRYVPGPGIIYFDKGNPVDAVAHSKSGIDALYSFFGWRDADFEFTEKPVTKTNSINKSRMGIILDGLRMMDDGKIIPLGPDTASDEVKDADHNIPLVKGPFIDYLYVVDEEYFSDGDHIVDEGKHGRWIWVILEGTVKIVKETPAGSIPLIRLGEGCFIGNISFLLNNAVRSASIMAVGDVQLGIMDSQSLSNELLGRSMQFRELIVSFVNRLKQVTDAAVAFYLKEHHLENLMRDMKPVIREGNALKGIARITEGEAAIVKTIQDQAVVLIKLGKGDCIGYVPFLDPGHEPHSASVYATSDFKVKPIPFEDMKKEFEQLSPTFKNIVENLMVCIGVTTKLACDFYKRTL